MDVLDYTDDIKQEDGCGDIALSLARIYAAHMEALTDGNAILVESSSTYEDGPAEQIEAFSQMCSKLFVAVANGDTITGAAFARKYDPTTIFLSQLIANPGETQFKAMSALVECVVEYAQSEHAKMIRMSVFDDTQSAALDAHNFEQSPYDSNEYTLRLPSLDQ